MKFLGVILAIAVAVTPSVSAAAMRCGKQLVLKGFNFDEVSQICGEADSTYSMADKYIYRSVKSEIEENAIAEVIKIDLWVYRGRENELSRNLYFENGILVKIELGKR